MTPTIGRIIYFKAYNKETYAAIITSVHSETKLDITVFYPGSGGTQGLTNIEQGNDVGTWDWMPYQKEQAANQKAVDNNGEINN